MDNNGGGINLTCGMCMHCGAVKDQFGKTAEDRGECRSSCPQVVVIIMPGPLLSGNSQPQMIQVVHSFYPPVLFSNPACADFDGGEEV